MFTHVCYPWAFILDTWLGTLMECGVDLNAYGQQEQALYRQGLTNWENWDLCSLEIDGQIFKRHGCLVSFTYGSSTGDWSIVVEDRMKDPNEDIDLAIPGSWIKE
jgi:hypothetical protein